MKIRLGYSVTREEKRQGGSHPDINYTRLVNPRAVFHWFLLSFLLREQ